MAEAMTRKAKAAANPEATAMRFECSAAVFRAASGAGGAREFGGMERAALKAAALHLNLKTGPF
jgi:hypothetical protein